MQLFRFSAAIVLVVIIALLGIAQEKRRLTLSRAISLQQYRTDQLRERRAHLQLRVHELTSPARASFHDVLNHGPQTLQSQDDSTTPLR